MDTYLGHSDDEKYRAISCPPFLKKTYEIVEDPETDHMVEWAPDGRSFVVKATDEFSKVILPQVFKHSNFSSFMRQLNTYGFRKIDPDRWEFAQENFKRGRRDLLAKIGRKKAVQQSSSRISPSPANPIIEVGAWGDIANEVETLKRDKENLSREVIRLRQNQQAMGDQLRDMQNVIHSNAKATRSVYNFMHQAMNNPVFWQNLLNNRRTSNDYLTTISTSSRKKRRASSREMEEVSGQEDQRDNSGAIVQYNPTSSFDFDQMLAAIDPNPNTMNGAAPNGGLHSAFDGMNLRQDNAYMEAGQAMPEIPHLNSLRTGTLPEEPPPQNGQHFDSPIFSEVSPSHASDAVSPQNAPFAAPSNGQFIAPNRPFLKEENAAIEDLDNDDWMQYLNSDGSTEFILPVPAEQASSELRSPLASYSVPHT